MFNQRSIHNVIIFLILQKMLQAYVGMSTEFLSYYPITHIRSYNTVWFIVSGFNALFIVISELSCSINRTPYFHKGRLRTPLNETRRCLLIHLLIFLWILPYLLYFLLFQPVKKFENYSDYLHFVVDNNNYSVLLRTYDKL